jgi:hypothetical protein
MDIVLKLQCKVCLKRMIIGHAITFETKISDLLKNLKQFIDFFAIKLMYCG